MNTFLERMRGWFMSFKKRVEKNPAIGKVAICVGHSRLNDAGARSVCGVSEWEYNNAVATYLHEHLKELGIASQIINDYPFKSYSKAVQWVAERTWGFDVAIELHFNSYSSSSAKGFEYLYYHRSAKGERLAEAFAEQHTKEVPGQNNRGSKAVKYGDRGYKFLGKTKPPALICEPFFGSNPQEWVLFDGNQETLAQIYARALQKYFAS